MATVTEGAVYCDVSRSGREDFKALRDHDRSMRPRWRLSGGEDFLDRFRVARRIEFLVLVLELSRVLPGVARAAPVRLWLRGRIDQSSLYFLLEPFAFATG